MPKADIAFITVIPEEYAAVVSRLNAIGCEVVPFQSSGNQMTQYGWTTCDFVDSWGKTYKLVVAMTYKPGPVDMSQAVTATVSTFQPRCVLLVGIAGGFPIDCLGRGDVVVSSLIYGYEYGKLAKTFQPRHNFTYQVSEVLTI